MKVLIPLRTGAGQNDREYHHARARRVKKERLAVAWMLAVHRPPAGSVTVHLCRVSPGQGLDAHDNLRASLKAPVDQVAEWLGRDDADPSITWEYSQRRGRPGEWMVAIEISADSAQGVGDVDCLHGGIEQGGVPRLVIPGRAVAGNDSGALDGIDDRNPAPIDQMRLRKERVAVRVDEDRHAASVARTAAPLKGVCQ